MNQEMNLQEIKKNFSALEKTYLREKLLLKVNQNTTHPITFKKQSGISEESIQKVDNFYNEFEKNNYTPVSEQDLKEFGENYANLYVDKNYNDKIHNTIYKMDDDNEIATEINEIYINIGKTKAVNSNIENREFFNEIQNKFDDKELYIFQKSVEIKNIIQKEDVESIVNSEELRRNVEEFIDNLDIPKEIVKKIQDYTDNLSENQLLELSDLMKNDEDFTNKMENVWNKSQEWTYNDIQAKNMETKVMTEEQSTNISNKIESLIGLVANNKEDENLGHKTKLFNELTDDEKAFFKKNAKQIAVESISEIQEGISEAEKTNIEQKFDAFFKQMGEKPKRNYEQQEVIDYLKKQLMYLGFGQDEKLHQQLEKSVLETPNGTKFQINTPYEKVSEGNEAHFSINFSKSEQGGVYLNSFTGVLKDGNTGEERNHTFGANKFTAKESINLLEGRSVKAQFTNKFTNELDDVFVKLKLKEDKNEFGNYQMQMYNKNYGINTADIVNKSQLIFEGENAEKTKEMVIKSLEKGNVVNVKFKDENNKEMQGKAVFNPQYKTINLYDMQMNRVNTNKPIKGLEVDNQHEKNNVREQSRGRSPH